MKNALHILKSSALFALIFTISGLLFEASVAIVNTVYYSILSPLMPRAFPTYNFVSQKEKYLELCDSIDLWAFVLLVAAVALITVIFDNERREHMIELTDGFYTVPEGARIYYSRYVRDDLIAASVAALPMTAISFLLAIVQLPTWLSRIIEMLVAPLNAIIASFGDMNIIFALILAYFLVFLTAAVLRLAFGFIGIKKWRAEWLSDTGIA